MVTKLEARQIIRISSDFYQFLKLFLYFGISYNGFLLFI